MTTVRDGGTVTRLRCRVAVVLTRGQVAKRDGNRRHSGIEKRDVAAPERAADSGRAADRGDDQLRSGGRRDGLDVDRVLRAVVDDGAVRADRVRRRRHRCASKALRTSGRSRPGRTMPATTAESCSPEPSPTSVATTLPFASYSVMPARDRRGAAIDEADVRPEVRVRFETGQQQRRRQIVAADIRNGLTVRARRAGRERPAGHADGRRRSSGSTLRWRSLPRRWKGRRDRSARWRR